MYIHTDILSRRSCEHYGVFTEYLTLLIVRYRTQQSKVLDSSPVLNIHESSNVKFLQLRSTSICLAAESTLIYQIL